MGTEELIYYIQGHKIAIYGIGYVAERFFMALERRGLSKQVEYFITTKFVRRDFHDIPVMLVNEIVDSEILICIAVHEASYHEIANNLSSRNVNNNLWIYPYLYDLILGKPKKCNWKVPLKCIWHLYSNYYWIAVRYAVIDQYYGNNSFGYEAYIKHLERNFGRKTATSRLDRFISLINEIEKTSFDETKKVLLFDDYSIIDGAHRLSISFYLNREYIISDIYEKNNKEDFMIHDESFFLSGTEATAIYDDNIIRLLDGINRVISRNLCVR